MRNFFSNNNNNNNNEMISIPTGTPISTGGVDKRFYLGQPEDGSLFATQPIDSDYIDRQEEINQDTMESDQQINSQLRSYLKLVGYGAVADTWNNIEVVDKYMTQMRNIDSSDAGIFGEALAVRREKEENLHHYKTAYDIWDKYPSIYNRWREQGYKSKYDAMLAVAEHVGNVLNPAESPTTYAPGMIVGKILGRFGGKAISKTVGGSVVEKGTQKYVGQSLLKRAGYTAMGDAVLALGLNGVYQDYQQKVGRQDNYNYIEGMTSLFGGLIGGGVEIATTVVPQKLRKLNFTIGGKKFDGFLTKKVKTDKQKAAILKKISLKNGELIDFWATKTKQGRKLLSEDNQFADTDFIKLYMFGNKELGMKGMVQTMTEDLDLVYFADLKKASKDGQFMAAFIKLMDESTSPQIKAAFTKKMRNVRFKGESPFASKLSQPTSWNGFMKALAFSMSDAGKTLNLGSQAQSMVLGDAKSVKYLVDGEKELARLKKIHPRPWHYMQAAWKRGVVSTWATSALNFSGWVAASATNTAADTGLLMTHIALAPLKLVGGTLKYTLDKVKTGESKINPLAYSVKEAKDIFTNQVFRLSNLLDPSANKEAFLKMLEIDTEASKALRHAIIGGVDVRSVEDLAKQFGYVKEVDGKIVGAPPTWMRINEDYYLKYAQKIMLVNAVDTFTKSQAYIGHMDRYLRNKYDMGFMEFTKQSDAEVTKMISSQEFFEMTQEVTDRTLEDIFTKSYQNAGLPVGLQEIATAVEKVGDIPVLGTQLPFGKFMNNTVAFLYDGLGGGSMRWMAKVAKYGVDSTVRPSKAIKMTLQDERRAMKGVVVGGLPVIAALNSDMENDSWWESTVRGTMRLSAVGQCVENDKKKIAQGLRWDQEFVNGELVSVKYMFPYSNCAILGRAYNIKKGYNVNATTGERSTSTNFTPEFLSDLADQHFIGQITRNSKSIMNMRTVIEDALDWNNTSWEELVTKAMSVPGNLGTGYTRPYGDAFQKLSTYYLGEDDVKLKVPTKGSYQAMIFQLSRYTSNLVRTLTGEKDIKSLNAVEDRSMFRADKTYTSGGWLDLLGMKSQGRMTYMEQLLNKTNLQAWKQGGKFKSKHREADNYINRIVAPILEQSAYQMLHDKQWNKLSPDDKAKQVQTMVSGTMSMVMKQAIEGSIITNQDFSFEKEGLGTEEFAQRLRLVQELGKLNTRDFTETIQNYNHYFNADISKDLKLRELEDMDTLMLKQLLNMSKDIKNMRK
tara:strand:+ start:4423 stop:8139 length:3717 start_codon:yes stop_codon:yes gene_type:complete